MLARGIQAITIPSALLWIAANKDQEVRDLQKSKMGENWWFMRVPTGARRVLPSGQFVNGTDNIVRIRKPQIWGQMFGGASNLCWIIWRLVILRSMSEQR